MAVVRLELEDGSGVLLLEDGGALLLEESGEAEPEPEQERAGGCGRPRRAIASPRRRRSGLADEEVLLLCL